MTKGFASSQQCSSCQKQNFLNDAVGFLKTVWGQLVAGPVYDDKIAPAFPQPHKYRDGIPYTGLVPTIRINAPANPNLTLNPVTSLTWYLRAVGRNITAPVRHTKVPYSKRAATPGSWHGRSG